MDMAHGQSLQACVVALALHPLLDPLDGHVSGQEVDLVHGQHDRVLVASDGGDEGKDGGGEVGDVH